ncbi:DUF4231 domain-containing protein [Geodermatophilus sp. URMC 61]|uniref:DUF4231 domain-containing protein n=1 Tax=Geodermatophilus sp. URMC 61 TaxID=3423411 RepID=UPI00406CC322
MSDHDGARPRESVTEPPPGTDPTWDRLQDQLAWYDRKSGAAQRAYKRVKIAQLLLAAAVPVAVAARLPGVVTALLGALVVVLEGVQQLYQWQTNWVLYRATNEALQHEKFLYLAGAGPYSGPQPRRVLAERVEGLVSQEHAKWTEGRHQSVPEPDPGAGPGRVTSSAS